MTTQRKRATREVLDLKPEEAELLSAALRRKRFRVDALAFLEAHERVLRLFKAHVDRALSTGLQDIADMKQWALGGAVPARATELLKFYRCDACDTSERAICGDCAKIIASHTFDAPLAFMHKELHALMRTAASGEESSNEWQDAGDATLRVLQQVHECLSDEQLVDAFVKAALSGLDDNGDGRPTPFDGGAASSNEGDGDDRTTYGASHHSHAPRFLCIGGGVQ